MINELYTGTGVNLPEQNPWKMAANGVIDLIPSNSYQLRAVNNDGVYWSSIGYHDTNSYTAWLTNLLYPAAWDPCPFGTPVRWKSKIYHI